VYAIDTLSGNYIWSFSNPFEGDSFIYSNFNVGSDGTVYFGGSYSSYFFAVDGLKGKLKWYYTTGNNSNYFASKAAFNPTGKVVYITSNGPIASVYAFSLSGDLLHSYTNANLINNFTLQSPTVGGNGTVYISFNQNLIALTETLSVKWVKAIGYIDGVLSLTWYMPKINEEGLIYVGSNSGSKTLYCFTDNGSSASLNWTYVAPSQSYVLSPVFGPSGQVYFASNTYVNSSPNLPSAVNQSSVISIDRHNGGILWKYNFLGTGTDDYYNWLYPAVGPNGKIYITNVVDSSLVVLNDVENNFSNYKMIVNTEASSFIYDSLCLSSPVFGNNGSVFWCNGNYSAPSIFGAGYPLITETFESGVSAPVFRPHLRSALAGEMPVLNLAKTMPFTMRVQMGRRNI
jgi:hypothetical protein